MNILCVSDIHGNENSLSLVSCDVLVVAGDICTSGDAGQVSKFADWLSKEQSKFNHVIIVAGNHDWAFYRNKVLCLDILRNAVSDKLHYLEDSECVIDGIKFYGSPWQPEFCSWAFNKPRGVELKRVWDCIPDDVNVLITHGPPFGIGDRVFGNSVGCLELSNRVQKLPDLGLHVFGHVHAGNGTYISEEHPGVHFCNASVCDENYTPKNSSYMFNFVNSSPYKFTRGAPVSLRKDNA